MAYDEELAERVRDLIEDRDGVTEKKMFGGLGWLLHGNMAVAAMSGGGLMARVKPEEFDDLLFETGASEMIMGDRMMKGWIKVAPEGLAEPADLARWVQRGMDFAAALPPK